LGRIVAKVRTKAQRVQITVIDNGCGLPKENRERLVEPYMTTRDNGTGLGLAIVQRITEQHGGTLTLADAPKRNGKVEGASVRIDFPIGEREGTSADKAVPEPGASAPSSTGEYTAEAEEEEGVTHGV
jgi:two-component system nitrogen regulation sensor histidine kinase NtrY